MIDRADIEAKAREIEEAITEAGESMRSTATMTTIGLLAAVTIAYLAGRRRGRSKSARIEIHRL